MSVKWFCWQNSHILIQTCHMKMTCYNRQSGQASQMKMSCYNGQSGQTSQMKMSYYNRHAGQASHMKMSCYNRQSGQTSQMTMNCYNRQAGRQSGQAVVKWRWAVITDRQGGRAGKSKALQDWSAVRKLHMAPLTGYFSIISTLSAPPVLQYSTALLKKIPAATWSTAQ